MHKIIWRNLPCEFTVNQEQFSFHPLRAGEIRPLIRFLRRNYPDLRISFQECYLKPAFYAREVTRAEHWRRDCRQRRVVVYVATNKRRQIVGMTSFYRETNLPVAVSGISSVAHPLRDTGLFKKMVHHLIGVAEASGIEHLLCIATVTNRASQQVFLNEGLRVCAIVPGEDRRLLRQGRIQYVPDIYFYRFFGTAEQAMLPERKWDLAPEVRKLWRAIRPPRARRG